MKATRRWPMAYLAAVLWTTGVFAGYYAVHKPVTAESFPLIAAEFGRLVHSWSAPALADAGLNLATAFWVGLAGFGLGRLLLGAFCLGVSRLESAILSTSLGLGAISLAVFFLGLAGLLYPWVVYALFTAASLPVAGALLWRRLYPHPGPLPEGEGLASLPPMWERFPSPFPKGEGRVRVPRAPNDRTCFALALFVALTEALALLAALAPPWAWDSLVYHLTGPELYLAQHRIVGGLDGMHFYFPSLVEMLFLSGMAMKGPIVANLIHWEFGLLAVGAVFCLGRRLSGARVAWLAAALLLSAPSIVILSSQAYVDLALLLYLSLSFGCAVEGLRTHRRSWLLIAAVFLGFAGGIKYTGLVGIMAVGAVAIVEARRGLGWRFLLGCGLVTAVVVAPWYLKNLAFTGNPFYPFLFGGEFWDSFRAGWVTRAGSGLAGQPWRLVIAPLEMTVLGVEGGWGYQAAIGPLFLALLPLLWIKPVARPKGTPARLGIQGKASLVFVGVLYIAWLGGVAQSELLRQTRLLFPAFGVLSVMVASAVYGKPAGGGLDIRRFFGGAIALALALALAAQASYFLADSPLPFAVGAESQEKYLDRHLDGYYEAAQFVNSSLGENAKVYFLWEPRSYYFRQPVQPDTILDNWRHLLILYGEGDAIAATLRRQGYTHVLVNLYGLRFFSVEPHREVERDQLDALLAFERRHLTLVYGDKVEAIDPSGGGSGAGSFSLSRLE